MPERSSPNLARRLRLAAELRRLREQAGLTGQQVRATLGWPSSSKLSNIERGTSGVKQADLERLLVLYGVADEHQAGLFALAEESREAGRLLVAGPSESDEQRRLLDAERDAASIWIWEPQLVPGLFQVPAYSRALMLAWAKLYTLPPGETDQRIAARRLRQDVLNRTPPLDLSVVIDESVLYRRIGGPAVMAEQLARMLAASELPGVDVRILPLDSEHVIGTGAFNYFKFRQIHDVPLHDLVTLDHLTGTSYADNDYETHQYAVAFESLRHDALDPRESRTLISRAAAVSGKRERLTNLQNIKFPGFYPGPERVPLVLSEHQHRAFAAILGIADADKVGSKAGKLEAGAVVCAEFALMPRRGDNIGCGYSANSIIFPASHSVQ